MAVREVLRMGDPRLRDRARPVPAFGTPALGALVRDLWDTLAARDGAGLAAPQIGVGLRLVVFGVDRNPRYPKAEPVPDTVLLNPSIEPLGEARDSDWEGCLSLPGLRGRVPRWRSIRYSGFGPDGQAVQRDAHGFHARLVQHECDHLDGILYPMRMTDLAHLGFEAELREAGLL